MVISRTQSAFMSALCLALFSPAKMAEDGAPASSEKELLRDPLFLKGATQGYANHLTPAERKDCLARWKSKGVTEAQWSFWEISEQLYFAQNPETPLLPRPGVFNWSTANQAKQLQLGNGTARMVFDTGKEWREGGRLDLNDKDGKPPKYGDPNTNWPHFLIGQHLAKDNNPGTLIPDGEKLGFDRFRHLRFHADIRLNHLLKSSSWDHREEYQAANHAIFYIAFVIMPKTASRVADAGKIYVLVPAIYSEGNNRHVPGSLPWVGIDQHGDGVYFSGSQPQLQAGKPVAYEVDVKQLIREAMSAATKQARSRGEKRIYQAEDYFVACLLMGWEVWGGFDTDVEFGNLSLKGTP